MILALLLLSPSPVELNRRAMKWRAMGVTPMTLGPPYPQPGESVIADDNGIIPSMYAPKRQRMRDDPDLIAQYQQQAIALAYLLEDRGISHFVVPAERVRELSMSRVEIEVDESERMEVRMES